MIRRRLVISAELWVETCKQESLSTFRVTKNALPADARMVRLEAMPNGVDVGIWMESEAFREDDPIDLSPVHFSLVIA